jgi:hypothetical protein
MREIGFFFAERNRDDLVLLYISGHGLKNDHGELFFAGAAPGFESSNAIRYAPEEVNQKFQRLGIDRYLRY